MTDDRRHHRMTAPVAISESAARCPNGPSDPRHGGMAGTVTGVPAMPFLHSAFPRRAMEVLPRIGRDARTPHMSRDPLDSQLLFELPVGPDFSMELAALKRGLRRIAGLDEAGRGPLAGPVVAAAVAFQPDGIPDGLDDSKKLSRERREQLFEEILAFADVSVASSSSRSIDHTDIRKASLDAMRRALCGLSETPCHALFDGRDVPPGIACTGDAVIKGDARSLSIAAASIVAKVTRDRIMADHACDHPGYGWENNKGYGTPEHYRGLDALGPTPLHRRSFAPVRAFYEARDGTATVGSQQARTTSSRSSIRSPKGRRWGRCRGAASREKYAPASTRLPCDRAPRSARLSSCRESFAPHHKMLSPLRPPRLH